jgi:hypothetical protein
MDFDAFLRPVSTASCQLLEESDMISITLITAIFF